MCNIHTMRKTDSTPKPDFTRERLWFEANGGPVAGIDEAGRGPWAGPVAAAAVILDPENIPIGLNDSKKLSAAKREQLFDEITCTSIVAIALAGPERIDEINILKATLWAMRTATNKLEIKPAAVLIDGNQRPEIDCEIELVIKGDTKSLSIAAASIIAKVTRDRIMRELAEEFPGYGWERNKGYGTAEHIKGIDALGITPHHRKSFGPIRRALAG